MLQALSTLTSARESTGVIRTKLRPFDIAAALDGIALTSASHDRRQQAERLLDVTLNGLRTRA
ncbi:hypothetical protein [Paramicrobacterium chengjingii]|uniref:SbtR family transcriptional regulator n=1 Tax=Paramicrobacterium chengjingii TaxID=2769067 RepID=UPI002E27BC21|nr:hypothetical protein [Microbacterium chengjingii]